MNFFEFASRTQALDALASILVARLSADLTALGQASLLLPGGSSPRALLPGLEGAALDWSRVRVTPTDERWVPAGHPQSNWNLLQQGLPTALCLDPRLHAEPAQAAAEWGAALHDWLPFSAVLLGMGEDGHFASLFPRMPGLVQALDAAQPPAALVGLAPQAPQTRLSLNLAMLLSTRWLGLLAFGERKRELIEAVLADTVTSREWPLHALLRQSAVRANIYWAP